MCPPQRGGARVPDERKPSARESGRYTMKLVSYRHAGQESFGRLVGSAVIDCRAATPYHSIQEVLHHEALPEIRRVTEGRRPDVEIADVDLLPVIVSPAKVICVGLNYKSHRDESGRAPDAKPTIFTRFADTQIGAGHPVTIPAVVEKFDYEGELAVIIGRSARHVDVVDAFSYVAGYAPYNDFSARDWQKHSGQWTPGKNFTGTGAFGPAMVTADEVGEVEDLLLETRVNNEVRQSARVGELIFTIPELIAYITTFTELNAGDVIVSGTPGGVGLFRDPPVFLGDGDVVEVEISRLGTLRTPVRSAQRVEASG
ncbi:fumarylacetoacetate hydrolase family protein [Pseudonocardia sp. GCM10023141]|uniref:fumarylacetoacetate hydrolase family protein n=1 Tax=Pseudonocardia sp. GCM10023141 TaxID=3252653 RepID=UPI00361A5793